MDPKRRLQQHGALCRAVGRPKGHELQRHPEEAGKAEGFHRGTHRLQVTAKDLRPHVDTKHHLQRAPLRAAVGRTRIAPGRQHPPQPTAIGDLRGHLERVAGEHVVGRRWSSSVVRVGLRRFVLFGGKQAARGGDRVGMGFGQGRVVRQPHGQETDEVLVVGTRVDRRGRPPPVLQERRPASHGEELTQQEPPPVTLGNRQLLEQHSHRLLRVGRQFRHEAAESRDPEHVHPPARARRLPPGLVERQMPPRIRPCGLPLVVVRRTMPGNVGHHVARPTAALPAVDRLADGAVAPLLGADRSGRRQGQHAHQMLRLDPSVVLRILPTALGRRLLDVGGRDLAAVVPLLEMGRRKQHLALPHIAEQLPSVEEPPVGETEERIDGHVVLQGPHRRHDTTDRGDRAAHPLEPRRTGGRQAATADGGRRSGEEGLHDRISGR